MHAFLASAGDSILRFFGIRNESGTGYAFWSGVGSDIGELAIVGALWSLVRQKNCHTHGCWRIGKHPVEGTPFTVCKHHHPGIPDGDITAAHIHRLHSVHLHAKEPK